MSLDTPCARIAFLSEHASPLALLGSVDAGGQNVYVSEVSQHLGLQGFAVDVFTRRDSPELPRVMELAPGVRVVHIDAGPAKFCAKENLWAYMPAFSAACQRFMAEAQSPYTLLHSNFWLSGWVACQLRQQLHIPVVQIFHAMGKTRKRFQGHDDRSPSERIEIESKIVREVDCLIAQCPSEQAELIHEYDAKAQKIAMIPSAVNTKLFSPVPMKQARSVIGLHEQDFVIVYVGRMQPRKDVRNIVRALAHLLQECAHLPSIPPIKLLLVGGETREPDPLVTPEIQALQDLGAELGVQSHLCFTGKRQQDMLRYYYSAGDVVVTTPWYEPFGLTPLEGMACGRPVIGSAVGGIPYTIADGDTGFVVPARDPVVLAARIKHLMFDAGLREQMGRAARERVEREFTWSRVAHRTANLYRHLLSINT